MAEWFTSVELAGLPGVPGTDRRVRTMADRYGWQARKRVGTKAMEYHISALPPETRAALIARATASAPAETSAQLITMPHGQITDAQRATATARAMLCRAIERMAAEGGLSITASARHLAELLRLGRADMRLIDAARQANDRLRDGHLIAPRTLMNWMSAFAKQGEAGLIPGRRLKDFDIPAWAGAFLKHYQKPTKPSVEDAYRAFKAGLNGEAPSIHQVRRFLAKLAPEAREQGRMGPREMKNIRPFKRRTFEQLLPNDIWTADGHTFDAEVQHPLYPGRVFRPEITTYADIRTRRIVGWSVELAESALAVLDGLRMGIATCGLPAVLYVDNGRGYANDTVRGVLERLGVDLRHSLPYNSQAKGVIERINQLWVRLAKQLPSYIGADMDAEAKTRVHKISRKELALAGQSRHIVSWAQFVDLCEQMVAAYNADRHSTLGMSPLDVWGAYERDGWMPETVEPEMLGILLRPRLTRTTHRGEVRLFNMRYYAPELAMLEGDEREVSVAYDIRDGSHVWIHDREGRLLAIAERDGNAAPYMPQSVLEVAREKRRQAQVNRQIDKIERLTGATVTGLQLEHQDSSVLEGLFTAQPIPELTETERAKSALQLERLVDAQPEETPSTIRDPMDLYRLSKRDPGALNDVQREYLQHLLRTSAAFRLRVQIEDGEPAEEETPAWGRAL
ncbi:MAG: DNA-binding protein [Pseudomonadota bacterium]